MTLRGLITLTTDFGQGSPYVAQMKGVILSINPNALLIDISHTVPPQDVRYAALVLDDCCWRFPAGTIHVVVVDPGVGTERAVLMLGAGGHVFVGPDNGVLDRIVRRHSPEACVRLTNSSFWLADPSATFHGRDIMAPVAAHRSLGVETRQFGDEPRSLISLDWPQPVITADRVEGAVIAIDSFGNAITNVETEHLPRDPWRKLCRVECNAPWAAECVRTYGERPSGTTVALIGSSGRLEVAVVNGNASERLALSVGTRLRVTWGSGGE